MGPITAGNAEVSEKRPKLLKKQMKMKFCQPIGQIPNMLAHKSERAEGHQNGIFKV